MVSIAGGQVSYGLKAGLNLPKIVASAKAGVTASVPTSTTTRFCVTGFAEIPTASNFAIQPGISLQGKGGKSDAGTDNFMSIETPVNAICYFPVNLAGSLFLGAGPYLGVNLSGTTKETGVGKSDLAFGPDAYDRLDYGLNFMGGFKLPDGFLINAGYGLGLRNMLAEKQASSAVTMQHRVLSFGVGFAF